MLKTVVAMSLISLVLLFLIYKIYKIRWNNALFAKQKKIRSKNIYFKPKKIKLYYATAASASALLVLLVVQGFILSTQMTTISEEDNLYSVDSTKNVEKLFGKYNDSMATVDEQSYVDVTVKGYSSGEVTFSEYVTNSDVNGVDEIRKTVIHNDFMYTVATNKVVIANIFPLERLALENEIVYENETPTGLYVDENTLVVFVDVNTKDENEVSTTYDISCFACPTAQTKENQQKIYTYSLDSKVNLKNIYTFEGELLGTKKVGKELLVIMQKEIDAKKAEKDGSIIVPKYKINDEILTTKLSNMYVVEDGSLNNVITIYDIDITNNDITTKSYLGAADKVFVSSKSVYLMQTDHIYNTSMTSIIKFDYIGGLSFKNVGKISGRIKNNESINEYKNCLRIVTTVGWGEEIYNNFYILDENLDEYSSIKNLSGAGIMSVNFLNDRVYILPLGDLSITHIIDTTDLKKPVLLKEVMIEGYTNYIYPYDENHILGISLGNSGSKDNMIISNQSINLVLFNINSEYKFTEVCSQSISVNADSIGIKQSMYSYKELTFLKENNLLSFPIANIEEKVDADSTSYMYEHGYHLYNFDVTNCFNKVGYVTHSIKDTDAISNNENNNVYYGSYRENIIAGLFKEGYLYTVSEEYIKVSNIDDPDMFIKEIHIGN